MRQEQRLLALVMSQIRDQGVASILSHVLFHIEATLPKPPAPLKLDLAMAQTKEDLSKAEMKEEVPETPEKQPTPQPAKAGAGTTATGSGSGACPRSHQQHRVISEHIYYSRYIIIYEKFRASTVFLVF